MCNIYYVNINGLDLNLLLAFESLVDERHVGRAAKRIGLSQPAFSNALARLRTRLEDPLFIRTSQGMIPTPRAEQLAGPIRSALAQLRKTFEAPQTFDPSASAQRFRIGMSDDVELHLVSLFARSMLSGELQMQTRRLDWLFTVPESDLRNGTLDLAIGYFPDARYLSSSFIMETLSEENNVVIARRGHAMWKRKLTLQRFTRLDHAAVIYRNQPWGLIDNELAARGLRRRLRLALPHCLSVLHAVASSDLVACIQESVVKSFGKGLNLLSCPEPLGLPPFALRMVWHRQRNDDPAQIWLRKLITRELGLKAASKSLS
ncbi:LysR family transcriptional regulator [Acidobacterium sp. S8]|uniref:LysR family transcriptional regulator n=1 Tax=Acidobacterium sp. S8 TaxID=1641854 RepID=UPI00131E1478|nr:LysR family transcriptional regulator [Acidobacterium sp. S8]